MEPNFSRYIWKHTRGKQIWILLIVALSMLPYYLAFDLPKLIVNGPILGEGFPTLETTQPFMPTSVEVPGVGPVGQPGEISLDRLDTLIALSVMFLTLVIVNGLFKYYINIYKGLLGERLLRRLRYDLVDRVLRFPVRAFRQIRGAEVASMVKDEVEPLGGFTGDAFVQPALLGGQALTALAFIFVQNVWLGAVAAVMAGLQFAIIPALRRRLIELGRERQLTARQLSGRVGEIVDGIGAIHVNDTSNFERADIADRLGRIFLIRYEIYKRKFVVKFLNNFLAQLTPFFFYLIGGYFTIEGRLDVGQLVAVINAYKELPGPLKELIDWDLMRQDVQVKYEAVVEQFDRADMSPPGHQALQPDPELVLDASLVATGLTVETDDGALLLDRVSFRLDQGERVALLGDAGAGSDTLAEALVGLVPVTAGRISVGDTDLTDLPEAVTGRRITYAASDPSFFHGSLRDNLLYGLKHAPVAVLLEPLGGVAERRRKVAEAQRSGNPDLDLGGTWIDLDDVAGAETGAAPVGDEAASGTPTETSLDAALTAAMVSVLDVVGLTDQVMEFASYSSFDADTRPELAAQIVSLRHAFREELVHRDMADLVIPFEAGSYNTEARVVDNLLFGVMVPNIRDPRAAAEGLALFRNVIDASGLGASLFAMGRRIAVTAVELFQDLPRDHPFYERLNFMDPDTIPTFPALLKRLRKLPYERVSAADRQTLIDLSFRYIEPRHRFGLLDETLMQLIVDVREAFHAEIPDHLRHLIELYDADRYLSSGTLIDNVVFGRVNHHFSDADAQIRDVIGGLMPDHPGLRDGMLAVGLDYDIGTGGRRLSLPQRQKLNVARALIRRSDFFVFNRPLTALDATDQNRVLTRVLDFIRGAARPAGVVWVVESPDLAPLFDRAVQFSGHSVVEDGAEATDATGEAEGTAGPTQADVVQLAEMNPAE